MAGRLYRSRRDRMLAGVAGGLAEMWGADPALVRIIWALLVILTGGAALLVYIVMAIVVPEEDQVYGAAGAPVVDRAPRPPRTGGLPPAVLVGGFLVILGCFFLIREIFPRIDFDWIWPLALVGLGAVLVVTAMSRGGHGDGPSGPPPGSPPEPSPPLPPSESSPPPPPPPAASSVDAPPSDERS
jgi:phage shock protein PspC (stress-responsive transcriptional regulator)